VLSHKLERFNLSDKLSTIASERTGSHFDGADDSIRIDDEGSTTCEPAWEIEDIIYGSHFPVMIGEHGIRKSFHKLLVLHPCSVREVCIGRSRKNSNPEFVKTFSHIRHILEFRRTDKGKISGIKKENHPFIRKRFERNADLIVF